MDPHTFDADLAFYLDADPDPGSLRNHTLKTGKKYKGYLPKKEIRKINEKGW